MDDLSVTEAPAPPRAEAPDRVGSLSARLSEALTAVGIAVRRREAEIELLDRTLAASSDAQSAAARQAADRMARVRAEHADELDLMQRARTALEGASTDAGELRYELEASRRENDEAAAEVQEAKEQVTALASDWEAERRRATELESRVAALTEDLEQARRALAARESELEQVWKELDVKSREAQELARLMGAFTSGGEPNGADLSSPPEEEPPPPPPPADDDNDVAEAAPAAASPRFAEAPDIELPVAVVHDVMDDLGGLEPPPSVTDAGVEVTAEDPPEQTDAEPALSLDDEVPAEPEASALAADEEAAPVEDAPPAASTSDEESHEPPASAAALADEPPAAAAAPAPDGPDDAIPDAPVDISVDDWGAVVEDDAPVAMPPVTPPVPDRAALDGELKAYLSAMGDDDDGAGPKLPLDTLFKATCGISDFQCATPAEVRLAGALQLQSWRPAELAQLIGMELAVVRQKLESYHERGLVEVVLP